jgi:hypothetical protein
MPQAGRRGKPRLRRSFALPAPGRELRNVIERATIFAQGGVLDFDLPLIGPDLTSCRLEAVDEVEAEYLNGAEMRRRERKNLVIVLQKTAGELRGRWSG